MKKMHTRSQRGNARPHQKPGVGGPEWGPAFISALAETGHNDRACEAAGIDRSNVYRRRQSDPDFAKVYQEALAISAVSLEAEAVRRAREGLRRMKFNAKTGEAYIDPETGKPYIEHEYSDTLLLSLLKRHFPDLYKDKASVEFNDVTPRESLAVIRERVRLAKAQHRRE